MSSLRVAIGIIYMAVALLAHGIWTEIPIQPAAQPVISDPLSSAVSEGDDLRQPSPYRSETRRMDMYGNPIETAIGDYRIDQRGEMYERHSPDTAVPRLGVPST
jgi:hypothetical protein